MKITKTMETRNKTITKKIKKMQIKRKQELGNKEMLVKKKMRTNQE